MNYGLSFTILLFDQLMPLKLTMLLRWRRCATRAGCTCTPLVTMLPGLVRKHVSSSVCLCAPSAKQKIYFVSFVVTLYCVTGRHPRNGGVHVCSFTSGRVFGCQTCASTTFVLKKTRMFWSRWPRSHRIFRLEKIGFGPLMLPRRSAASPCMSRLLALCTPPLLIPVSQHQI